MIELSSEEKSYNDWWMSRFDDIHYKTIALYQHGKEVQTYTTANADYSDAEDAEDAILTAELMGVSVSSVSVDGMRFKSINGQVRRIANVKVKLYRKTSTITAEQFDGSQELAKKYGIRMMPQNTESGVIDTLERTVVVHYGDWIATGVNGEHWPIADEVFKKIYVELPVIPRVVADWIEERRHNNPHDLRSTFAFSPYADCGKWCGEWIEFHSETFARAWLDGYQVEEGK